MSFGLSKGAAYYRKTAAKLVQRYPEIIEPLRDGRLCLSSVTALAKVITPENRAEVLPRFFHRSKREAAEVVAEIRPVEALPRRAVVTAVRPAPPAAEVPALPLEAPGSSERGRRFTWKTFGVPTLGATPADRRSRRRSRPL